MRRFHRRSLALVAALAGAATLGGAVCAQAAAPVKSATAKADKKAPAASVIVVVTNSRAVALTELDATPSGLFLPKKIVSNLGAGQRTSTKVATDKDCVFDLHGIFADGSNTDSTSVDLCKDHNVNLSD